MNSMRFAVFLDVDGVLNTRTTCQRTPDGYTGIDDPRVEILAKVLEKYDCHEVVLTSDWKEMGIFRTALYFYHIYDYTGYSYN